MRRQQQPKQGVGVALGPGQNIDEIQFVEHGKRTMVLKNLETSEWTISGGSPYFPTFLGGAHALRLCPPAGFLLCAQRIL